MREADKASVENETAPTQPLLKWEGISEEGEGKFAFNGPGLLRHAEEKGFQLSKEDIETLQKATWETGAEAEEISSLDDIDQDFIQTMADFYREDLERETSS